MVDSSPFMGAVKLREHLRDYMRENVGTSDLAEGNRRLAVIQSWRAENAG